jgi:hypothetical protein
MHQRLKLRIDMLSQVYIFIPDLVQKELHSVFQLSSKYKSLLMFLEDKFPRLRDTVNIESAMAG